MTDESQGEITQLPLNEKLQNKEDATEETSDSPKQEQQSAIETLQKWAALPKSENSSSSQTVEPEEQRSLHEKEADAKMQLPESLAEALGLAKEINLSPVQGIDKKAIEQIDDLYLSSERKEQLDTEYKKSIGELREILRQHDIELPSTEDLLSKLHIVRTNEAERFEYRAVKSMLGKNEEGYGYAIGNDVAVLDGEKMPPGLPLYEYVPNLVRTGLHELIHTATQVKAMSSQSEGMLNAVRVGIQINPRSGNGSEKIVAGGLWRINEGFTEYLAHESIRRAGGRVTYTPEQHKFPLRAVTTMVEKIGLGPFLHAAFKKDGLMALSDALDEAYGENALVRIATAIEEDGDASRSDWHSGSPKTREIIQPEMRLAA